MSDEQVGQTIRDYLPEIVHLSLGTSANNRPWVCEVHFVYDNQLNLYFLSKPSQRHSQEIAKNPNVAGNIVKQHTADEKPRGVYFEGTAEMINAPETHDAYKLYDKRFGLGEAIRKEIKADPEGHKFYKIMVSDYYLFDARNSKPSQKYHLKWSS